MKKIKVKDLDKDDLERTKQLQIAKCKYLYEKMPFITPIYLAVKLGVPLKFILDHKKEIGLL